MRLKISWKIYKDLKEIVFSTQKETGCALFGTKDDGDFQVLHLVGPGKKSKRLAFHYEADHKYQEDVFNELLQSNPTLCFMGELHVHPHGMKNLSHGDRITIKKVLKTQEEFVGGIILREPRIQESDEQQMEIYPVYFSREKPEGENCELVIG